MAAQADAISSGVVRVWNSVTYPSAAWDDLMMRVRSKHVALVCPNCHGQLGGRRSRRGTQHFFHRPGESPDCVNRSHEGESDQHREAADMLAADAEHQGSRAEREWAFPGGVADVATWPKDVRPSDPPGHIIELERKTDGLAEYLERDRRRQVVTRLDARGNIRNSGVAWFAWNRSDSTYLYLPQLYLDREAANVTDGAFYLEDGDMAEPVPLGRSEAVELILEQRMARVPNLIYRGDGTWGEAWAILSRSQHGDRKRGRRRKRYDPDAPRSAGECDREPMLPDELFPHLDTVIAAVSRSRAARAQIGPHGWPICQAPGCGRELAAGQHLAGHIMHLSCGERS